MYDFKFVYEYGMLQLMEHYVDDYEMPQLMECVYIKVHEDMYLL